MVKTFSFPSVYEATIREYYTSNDPILGFSKIKLDGVDYIVGLQALFEGVSPHKAINASPADSDYRIISQSAILLASNACMSNSKFVKLPNLSITTGFPFATFQSNKEEAEEYFKAEKVITYYKAEENGNTTTEQKLIPACKINILPELAGCDIALRKGENPIDGNFIIISLGYGTCEGAVSKPEGLLSKSTFSTHGISYAVDLFTQELNKNAYLRLKTDHQVDQIFTKGFVYIDRKRKDFGEEKRRSLQLYYSNVISPAIKRYISDEDFEVCSKIVLVGGGAYHQDLVNMFTEEFGEFCPITTVPSPEKCASIGYAINSKLVNGAEVADKDALSYVPEDSSTQYIGIDIGNATTCVSILL